MTTETRLLVVLDGDRPVLWNRYVVDVATAATGTSRPLVLVLNRPFGAVAEAIGRPMQELDLDDAGFLADWRPRVVIVAVYNSDAERSNALGESPYERQAEAVLFRLRANLTDAWIHLFANGMKASDRLSLEPDRDALRWDKTVHPVQNQHNPARRYVNMKSAGSAFFSVPWLRHLIQNPFAGPHSEFGYRVPADHQKLRDRPPDHLLCAILGGSAAYGVYAHYSQSAAAVLERLLNEAIGATGRYTRATVLNFATPANILVSDILTHSVFVEPLRPDVIILHSGYNDLLYGRTVPAETLERFQITQFEIGFNPDQKSAPPKALVDVVMSRAAQLFRHVRANGGRAVWGLPAVFESKSLTENENRSIDECVRKFMPRIASRDYFRAAHYYAMIGKRVQEPPFRDLCRYVEFDGAIRRHPQDADLFFDPFHLTADGEALVAGVFRDAVLEVVANGERDG